MDSIVPQGTTLIINRAFNIRSFEFSTNIKIIIKNEKLRDYTR
jgi:hypothetical protein